MDKKSKDRFEISELFMVMADKDRYFTGIIKRLKDTDGMSFSCIKVRFTYSSYLNFSRRFIIGFSQNVYNKNEPDIEKNQYHIYRTITIV